jgi:hypothetical protein
MSFVKMLNRLLGFENGALHARLEAVFALMFGFWAHFLLRKKPGFAGVPPPKRPMATCGGPAPTIPCAASHTASVAALAVCDEEAPAKPELAHPACATGTLIINFESMSYRRSLRQMSAVCPAPRFLDRRPRFMVVLYS